MMDNTTGKTQFIRIYLAIFLTAFVTLALQIVLTRILSVITDYQLAFFSISLAMLGMAAGAVLVFIKKDWFTAENLIWRTAALLRYLSISLIVSILVLINLKVNLNSAASMTPALLIITLFCLPPFFISGIIVTSILTKAPLSIGRLYASDLTGAALGCPAVVVIMMKLTAPDFYLLLALFTSLISFYLDASHIFWQSRGRLVSLLLVFFSTTLLLNNLTGHYPLRVKYFKGHRIKKTKLAFEKWNSFSHIIMIKPDYVKGFPGPLWSKSQSLPKNLPDKLIYQFLIDGLAGTAISPFRSLPDIEYLKYDLTNFAHFFVKPGQACVIGVGSGRDIHAALAFKHKAVTGVEINPIFINAINGINRNVAGLSNRIDVKLILDDGRSWFERNPVKCDLLMMSLIDTWASTGTGSMSLTENSLYTLEAWQTFYNRLSPQGIFTVSRWYDPKNPIETSRMFALALGALYTETESPARHIALVANNNLATILIKKSAFSQEEIDAVRKKARALKYHPLFLPGYIDSLPLARSLASARNFEELNRMLSKHPMNLHPPADENPYFFNMLRLRNIFSWRTFSHTLVGNLRATLTLIILFSILLIFTVVMVLIPLMKGALPRPKISAALYFFGIGSGFMLIEIGLLQRLTPLLNRPELALGVLLFGLILSTSIGSFVSDRLAWLDGRKSILIPAVIVFLLIMLSLVSAPIMSHFIGLTIHWRILVALAILAPIGFFLGFCFPIGMRLFVRQVPATAPWLWGLNGIAGVLASVLAVLISLYAGITMTFISAALFYTLAGVCLLIWMRA